MAGVIASFIMCMEIKLFSHFKSNTNRRFPEITGKDNLTVFSYSGRVKSPEWRQQLKRANLWQF